MGLGEIVLSEVVLAAQSCLTLCDPTDCSPPGSSVHGVLQARIQEWVDLPSPGALPSPGVGPALPVSSALQTDGLPAGPSGSKPNTKG